MEIITHTRALTAEDFQPQTVAPPGAGDDADFPGDERSVEVVPHLRVGVGKRWEILKEYCRPAVNGMKADSPVCDKSLLHFPRSTKPIWD